VFVRVAIVLSFLLIASSILSTSDAGVARVLDDWRARQTAAVAETPSDDG